MISEKRAQLAAALVAFTTVMFGHPARAQAPDRLPESVMPTRYTLDLQIDPEARGFSGTTRIAVSLKERTSQIWLHAKSLKMTESYALDAQGTRIGTHFVPANAAGLGKLSLDRPLDAGAATLVFQYDAPWGDEKGLYSVSESGHTYAIAYFWPLSARAAFPCFDEPGIKAPFDVSVTTNRNNAVIANSPESNVALLAGDQKRVTFASTRPLSTPLVMLAVGPFDVVDAKPLAPNEVRQQPVPLRGIAGNGKGPRLRYALANTPGIVAALERYFGIPYPYAKLDFIAIPRYGGGMETAAAISYSERYVLLDERPSVIQERSFAWAHAHEIAHQWFGNVVTPVWFDDLWLNESFASWMGNRALHLWAPERDFHREAQRSALRSMDEDSRIRARSLRLPIRTEADTISGFSSLIYGKGEAVLAMFEGFLGEQAFQRGVRLYLNSHRDASVTASDFFAALEAGAGRKDIGRAFASFVDQPGVPLLTLDWQCDTQQVTFDLAQSRSLPLGSKLAADATWQLPVCLAYQDAGATRKQCLLMTSRRQTVSYPARSCPKAVMPNAQGSGYYRFALPAVRVQALTEQFTRLDAREALALEDSLAAQVAAGELSFADYLDLAPRIAAHSAWDVATAPIPRLTFALHHTNDEPKREALRRLMRTLYSARMQEIGLTGDSPADLEHRDETAQLRNALAPFLAFEARDARLRGELARLGKAYIHGDKLHPEVMDPTLVPTALGVAAQELGQPFATRLWKLLRASTDVVFRRSAGEALARMTAPAQAAWFRELLLSVDLSSTETPDMLLQHAQMQENLEGLWGWEKNNLSAIAKRIPAWRQAKLVQVVAGFCDPRKYEEAVALFTPVLDQIQDSRNALEAAREETEICSAYVQRMESKAQAD